MCSMYYIYGKVLRLQVLVPCAQQPKHFHIEFKTVSSLTNADHEHQTLPPLFVVVYAMPQFVI